MAWLNKDESNQVRSTDAFKHMCTMTQFPRNTHETTTLVNWITNHTLVLSPRAHENSFMWNGRNQFSPNIMTRLIYFWDSSQHEPTKDNSRRWRENVSVFISSPVETWNHDRHSVRISCPCKITSTFLLLQLNETTIASNLRSKKTKDATSKSI